MQLELTKEDEKGIREIYEYHDPLKNPHDFPCPRCAILLLLAEIDRLREENMQLRVNP